MAYTRPPATTTRNENTLASVHVLLCHYPATVYCNSAMRPPHRTAPHYTTGSNKVSMLNEEAERSTMLLSRPTCRSEL